MAVEYIEQKRIIKVGGSRKCIDKIQRQTLPEGAGITFIGNRLKVGLRQQKDKSTHPIKRDQDTLDSLQEISTNITTKEKGFLTNKCGKSL